MRRLGGLYFLLATTAFAQDPGDVVPPVTFPTIAREASALTGFVPKGWLLEAQATGDLNRDTLADSVLVLHMNDARNRVATSWDANQHYDSNPRMLVVAFARKGGGYDLAASDHQLISRLENQNQDDPFDEITISNGVLRVKQRVFMSAGGWWMGNYAHTFRWRNGGFKLIGYDRNGVRRNTGETDRVSINYLTRTKLIEAGNIDGSTDKSRRLRLSKMPLFDLTRIGDGLMFDTGER